MKSSQVKWLLIGLAGAAFCMALLVGGVFFIAMSAIKVADEDFDWSDSESDSSLFNNENVVDAPAQWRQQAEANRARYENPNSNYQRLLKIYERVSPYAEMRPRLFLEGDIAFAQAELRKQFAAIEDPLAAFHYSLSIEQLSQFTYDTDPEELRALMRRWTEEYPKSHFAWLVRGHQAISYGWYWRGDGWSSTVSDEGRRHFREAIDEAADCFDKAYRLEPNDPEIAAGMIVVCKAQSRPRREMETYFERAIAIAPAHLGAYHEKFQYLRPVWSGSWPEYEELLDSIDEKVEEQGHPMLQIAKRFAKDNMESERYSDEDEQTKGLRAQTSRREWMEIREEMAEYWPDDVLIRAQLARELMRQGRQVDAHEHFEIVGSHFPMDLGHGWTLPVYHQQRLQSFHRAIFAKRGQERLEMALQTLEIDPEYYLNYQAVGVAHTGLKEYDLAEEAIFRAMELAPKMGGPHVQLAGVYQRMGRYEEAMEELRAAQPLQMDDSIRKDWNRLEGELKQKLAESEP